MKVYSIELSYFSGVEWKWVSVTIEATSMIQLIRCFLDETKRMYSHSMTPRDLWDRSKDSITFSELTFPKIT